MKQSTKPAVKVPKDLRGDRLLHHPIYNKGTAFTMAEREAFGLEGLLPACVETIQMQSQREKALIDNLKTPLEKFMYLQELCDRNERLYYYTVCNNVKELTPFVYTPTVGEGCQKWSHIIRRPHGIYITIHDLGKIGKILGHIKEDIKAIVVTDGERILGLGDLGANGMGIPVGKLALYSACAGVPPENTLPVTLDVGTNTQSLLDDPMYIGLHQKRERGPTYKQLIAEFFAECQKKWGRTVFIQFEDFGSVNAFDLLEDYTPKATTFNDDIQGTGAVILAGLINCCKLTGKKFEDQKVLFLGAGEAGIGISNSISNYLIHYLNVKPEEAHKHCWLFDVNGLVCKERKDLVAYQLPYAHEHALITREQGFIAAVDDLKPTAIVGVSACAKLFTEEVCKNMAKYNEKPIIFALSNPTSKAECTAQDAYTWTEGKCIFAAGSPFEPVTIADKKYVPGQGNNMYLFPAVGLALIATKAMSCPESILLAGGIALANCVSDEELKNGTVFPDQSRLREVTFNVALAVAEKVFDLKLSALGKKPADLKALLESSRFDLEYPQLLL